MKTIDSSMQTPGISFRSILKYTLIIGGISIFLFYALWQARLLLTGPVIVFMSSPETAQTTQIVDIEGQARNITHLSLNGRDIYTDKNGYFKEALVLENGYTIATVAGVDRYGRTSQASQSFVYQPLSSTTNIQN